MKIVLTTHQAIMVVEALEWAQNPDFPDSDPYNQQYQRIINKIREELENGSISNNN